MGEPVAAKDVQVARLWQAKCRVHACGWDGELLDTFQAANAERQKHLDEHRAHATVHATVAAADPVLAAAIADRELAARLYVAHDRYCQLPAAGCYRHKSLAAHAERTREQVALLESPGRTTEMF